MQKRVQTSRLKVHRIRVLETLAWGGDDAPTNTITISFAGALCKELPQPLAHVLLSCALANPRVYNYKVYLRHLWARLSLSLLFSTQHPGPNMVLHFFALGFVGLIYRSFRDAHIPFHLPHARESFYMYIPPPYRVTVNVLRMKCRPPLLGLSSSSLSLTSVNHMPISCWALSPPSLPWIKFLPTRMQ